MHAADAVVDDLDAIRQRLTGEAAGDLAAEAVVGEEEVADAGHQHLVAHRSLAGSGSISSGPK